MLPLGVLAALLLAAMLGGAMNAVAGGGSFLTFPTLVFAGVAPIPANATSAVALWPGSASSSLGYREDLRGKWRTLVLPLAAAAVVGGLAGAVLLLSTPAETFRRLVPWLLLAATAIFAVGPSVTRALQARRLHMPFWLLVLVQLAIAIYGGYFGGGMGIMMLAAYSAMGMGDLHLMNGVKSVMGMLLNAVAIVAFIVKGVVAWPYALVMLAGSLVGGYAAARLARRMPTKALRPVVIAIGAVLSIYFFWTIYFA